MAFCIEDNLYTHFKSFYNRSPQVVKNVMGKLYKAAPTSLRYGKKYDQCLSLLNQSQWWPKRRIFEYQWERIEKLLKHAYNNVPYYKKLFDENGIYLKSIQNFEDFKMIPLLTREAIQNNMNDLLATNYKKSDIIQVISGGSSGKPLKLYYEKGISRSMENAFIMHLWNRYGYRVGDKVVVLRGEAIPKTKHNVPSYYEPIRNRLYISSYHLNEENINEYIAKIKEFDPKFLHVYPSSLYILAKFLFNRNISPFRNLKGILASSETLYDWQIELFEKTFKCRVFHWYGLTELVAFAGVCEVSDDYHIFPEYSYVEMIDPDHEVPEFEGERILEIVGTNFANDAMPLIRYRTLDYGIKGNQTNCDCGRHHQLIKRILGRKQEFFIDKNNSYIPFTGYNRPLRHLTDKIFAYQYNQNVQGNVILNIEQQTEITVDEIQTVHKKFKEIWPFLTLQVKIIPLIPRTKSGKFLYLKQNVKSYKTMSEEKI